MPAEDQDLPDDDRGMDQPSTTPAASSTPPPSAPAATPQPSTPAPETPAAPAAPLSARDWAKQTLNYDTSQYADDASMLRALVAGQQAAQQRIQTMEQERAFWLQRATQPATPAAAPADPLAAYKGPEYDPRWLAMVDRDEKGNIVAKPGTDPTVVPKLLNALQWRQNFVEKFTSDPAAFMQPLVEQQAKTLLEKMVDERLGGYKQEQYQQKFVAENARWLFEHDAQGNPIRNPVTGGYVGTAEGQRFLQYVKYANDSLRINDPRAQEEYARALLARDMALPHLQNQQAAKTGDAAKQQLIDELNRRPSQSGSTVAAPGTGHLGAPQNKNLDIASRLKAAFDDSGITDAQIAAEDQ